MKKIVKKPNAGIAKARKPLAARIEARTGGKRVQRGKVAMSAKGHMRNVIPVMPSQSPNIPGAQPPNA